MIIKSVITFLALIFCISAYEIRLQDDGPIVRGSTIRFEVKVYDDNGLTTDNIRYDWNDDAIPRHTRQSAFNRNGTDFWEVAYNATIYPAGSYIAQVVLMQCTWLNFCYQVGSARIEYDITEKINGELILLQNNKTAKNSYVSTKEEVVHEINVKKTDMDFIKTAPSVRTYWFVDCTYYGITNDLRFPFNFTVPDEDHLVEALVVADFSPPVPTTTVPPSTTTTRTTTTSPLTTTPRPTSTSTTSSTTRSPTSSQSTLNVVKRYADADPLSHPYKVKVWKDSNLVPYNVSFPFVCNSSYISTEHSEIYGYFYKKFETKDPLTKVNVTGNNWIQPGDLLSLRLRCNGSKNFQYCVEYIKGEYNVTGNETCEHYKETDQCDFNIRRYLMYPKSTILVIIENDVSKEVTPVTVNIYKVKKEGQLSVIVVPVAFSLVAVVLIVFGVAYYFQNRSRFIVEVADFNFGQNYTDMEYKTFRERLRDSMTNAFTRTPASSSSEVPVWPPGRKYGSMT